MAPIDDEARRWRPSRGLRALGEAVAPLAAPILKRRGLALASLVRTWPEIVGDALARRLSPERLVFARGQSTHGTLHLRLGLGALAPEVLHSAPVIIERINASLGWAAVARLRLVHAPADPGAQTPAPAAPPVLSAQQEADLAGTLAAVADPQLRAILESLGRASLAGGTPAPGDGTAPPAGTLKADD